MFFLDRNSSGSPDDDEQGMDFDQILELFKNVDFVKKDCLEKYGTVLIESNRNE